MDPYERIARFYEAEYGRLEADVAFFARQGRTGTLLVLGCGTGRVGRVLGSERRVIGLDRSEAMLAEARRRAPDATYVAGDMRGFDVGRVDEIVAPNGAFAFLDRRSDQQACLASCHRALPQGGVLWLDLPMPDFRRVGDLHTPETTAWEGLVDDRPARRTREAWRFPVGQRLELTDRYYVEDALVATSPLRLRWVFPAESEWMLESCGFYVDATFGDYTGRSIYEGCPRLLVRGVKL